MGDERDPVEKEEIEYVDLDGLADFELDDDLFGTTDPAAAPPDEEPAAA